MGAAVCHFFNVEPEERPVFEALAQDPGFTVTLTEKTLTPKNAADYQAAEVVAFSSYMPMGASILEALPNLKLLVTRSTGYNHIDQDYLTRRGIVLCNLVDYSTVSVAEQVIGLMLSLAKRFAPQWRQTREGQLRREHRWMGAELAGKTLGVWGTGATGQATLRMARAFDMRLLATSRTQSPELAETLGFRYVPFETLLAQSDFFSLHVAQTPETLQALNQITLPQMKPGAYLINTSRGGLIDSRALLRALETDRLAGAALDVLPTEATLLSAKRSLAVITGEGVDAAQREAMLADLALMQHPKVLMTPHTAFYTTEAVIRMAEQTVENIRAFRSGQSLRRLV